MEAIKLIPKSRWIFQLVDGIKSYNIDDLKKMYCRPGIRYGYFTLRNIDPYELRMNVLYCFFKNHYVVVFDEYAGVYNVGIN